MRGFIDMWRVKQMRVEPGVTVQPVNHFVYAHAISVCTVSDKRKPQLFLDVQCRQPITATCVSALPNALVHVVLTHERCCVIVLSSAAVVSCFS
jgi:hypothetical protein